ncbi:hypothetical protein OG21DRAFT_1526337 [Imleria badia]|nr:hypothetical protein OG21DRAFT_1526337 [Imleria badia]
MDEFFDFNHAKYLFTEYTKTWCKDKNMLQFLAYNKNTDYHKKWYTSPVNKDNASRMVVQDDESGEIDELILTIQGYLIKKDLPPIQTMPRGPAMAKYIKQSATIVGLGLATFDNTVLTIRTVHLLLTHNYTQGKLQPWKLDTYKNQHIIDLGNRYLTSRQCQLNSAIILFKPGVNSNGILRVACLAADEYSHLEENKVTYRKPNTGYTKIAEKLIGRKQGPHVRPIRVQTRGRALVKANFSVVAYPFNQQTMRMHLILRLLALIHGGLSTEADQCRNATMLMKPLRSSDDILVITRKRKFYEDNDIEAVQQRMKLMEMQSDSDEMEDVDD